MTEAANNKLKVLVTGFEAFGADGYSVHKNTSGEAVKFIEETEKNETNKPYNLTTKVIPVSYQHIDEVIPQMWQEMEFDLSIHVGVDPNENEIKLEKRAEKARYCIEDNDKFCPITAQNPFAGPDTLATDLDVEEICKMYNQDLPEGSFVAKVSEDAGKYVCEYTYYTSLALYELSGKRKNALFIHVPLMTEDEEIRKISEQLQRLIKICVDHVISVE